MINLFVKILLYLYYSLLLGWIPVNRDFRPSEEGIEIFISSNGVHTDFVVPINTAGINWRAFFQGQNFGPVLDQAPYIAFGWGDKGFYLNTPEWKDLTFKTAVVAVFTPSGSAMHVTLWGKPVEDELTKKVRLSRKEYIRLNAYIRNSFLLNSGGRPVRIDHPGYGPDDLFFESVYQFHLFNTCNIWTNRGMKKTGIRTCVWSPFDKAILYQVSKIKE